MQKSIFGISQLGVAPAFPMPIFEKSSYELAQVPHDRTLVSGNDIAKLGEKTFTHNPTKIIKSPPLNTNPFINDALGGIYKQVDYIVCKLKKIVR